MGALSARDDRLELSNNALASIKNGEPISHATKLQLIRAELDLPMSHLPQAARVLAHISDEVDVAVMRLGDLVVSILAHGNCPLLRVRAHSS